MGGGAQHRKSKGPSPTAPRIFFALSCASAHLNHLATISDPTMTPVSNSLSVDGAWTLGGVVVDLAFVLVVAAVLCWGFVRLLIPLARRIGWTDKPDARKQHLGEVPLVGGTAIAATLLVVGLWHLPWPEHTLGLALGTLLMLLVGARDDMVPIRARYRFGAQLLAALALMAGGTLVHQLGELVTPHTAVLGALALPFTLVAVAGLINAFNMTDGLDGLCGGHALASIGCLLFAASLSGAPGGLVASVGPVPFALAGALVGFLALNAREFGRARAMTFLGDGGSMLLGLAVAWLAIRVTQSEAADPVPPVVALWAVTVPVFDMFSCILRRIRAGTTPMTADRQHMHHLLLEMSCSPRAATRWLVLSSATCGAVGIALWQSGAPDYLVFWLWVFAFTVYTRHCLRFWAARTPIQGRAPMSTGALPSEIGDLNR